MVVPRFTTRGMVSCFQIMQTLGKNESMSTFLLIPLIAYMLKDNEKSMLGRNSMVFNAPDKPPYQEVNFDVISNVPHDVLKYRQ